MPATAIAFTGPSEIIVGVPAVYTLTPDGDATGIEPAMGTTGNGTWTPVDGFVFVGSEPLEFTYEAHDAESPITLSAAFTELPPADDLVVAVGIVGPFFVAASQYHTPGSAVSQHHLPGSVKGQHHTTGSVSGQHA